VPESCEFSVYQFYPNKQYRPIVRFVDSDTAAKIAKNIIEGPSCECGVVDRVIITDGGDCTIFEWQYGKGIIWPVIEHI